MILLTRENLKGNWGTLLLPVNADDTIDYSRLADELDYLVASGVDGIYSNGTAGEFHNQTEQEFDSIQQLLSEKCRSAGKQLMPFQIGAAHPSPFVSLERIKRSVSLKPDAFQVILPDWVITNEHEQVDFLMRMVDEASGIPLVLYNPPHAKKVLTPAELEKLCRAIPQLIGVKLAGGDKAWFDAMKWSINRFSVFVPGHFLASGVKTKVADGAYSNVACLSPAGAQAWWELMKSDMQSALEIEKRILLFFDDCIVPFKNAGYSNPALDKLLAAAGGWANTGTRLRWPYRWIAEDEVERVALKARSWLPEFF
ncbi:MAG: dihydrodipicolinate synthase family protein [Chitinophagaceae bacterium]|nr:MAG: dihydrodipicolinate synthase family protein [Chitinophagaceae bacterium]